MRSLVRRFSLASLLVGGALVLSVAAAHALSLTTSYASPVLTINVTSGGASYNQLEVPCKAGDVAGSYSVSPVAWSISSVHVVNGGTFVSLVRSSSTSSDESIALTGPAGRGIKASVLVSNSGANVQSGDGPTMLQKFSTPGLGPIGLAVLLALLIAAGSLAIARMRRAPTPA